MSAIRNNLWVLATVGLMSAGGCVTTGSGGLSSSAERLERNAYALEQTAHDEGERQGFRRDARELAEEARDFRRTVEDRSADHEDLEDAFRDVSRRYHAMRDEVERSHNRDVEADFRPVTEAYLDVEHAMRSREDRTREDRDREARYSRDD